ncbi:MAG: ectoine synthase [bacterium]|nr:ectoine synthase [bacterium]
MIIRRLDEVLGTEREVSDANWNSRRLLLAADGLGFSLHDTLIRAGTSIEMQYRHHVEAVYCVEGRGSIRNLEDGAVTEIVPGTLYALDGHERHLLAAESELRLVCVFNPALTGDEVHDADGTYPPTGSV